jgi:hypothetical protein
MPFDGRDFGAEKVSRWRRWRLAKKLFSRTIPSRKVPVLPAAAPPRNRHNLEALQLLTMARALIAERRNWAQGRYETIGGRRCAVGAVCVAAEILGGSAGDDACEHLLSVALDRGFGAVETMNDRSTHQEILWAFDEAIARATKRLITGG